MEELKYVIEDSTIAELLGVQNFSTDEAAILELVKNAYDANALNLKITFQNDTLRFEDNGIGMNADDIKKHWMHIGKSSKEYEIIDDIVFIDYSPANTLGMELMFADKNGKINYDASEKAGFGGIQFYNVEGKDIILEHGRYSLLESTVCDKVALGLGNEIAITYDKIRYLGNNEFDIEKKYKELTYNEVVSDTNKFHFVCE